MNDDALHLDGDASAPEAPSLFVNHANVAGVTQPLSRDPAAVAAHPGVLARAYALSEPVCRLVDLAVVSAALGACRGVVDPLTPCRFPLGLNLLVIAPAGVMAEAAVLSSAAALTAAAARATRFREQLGPRKLHQRRIELEQICASLLDQLRDPKIPPRQPCTIPVPGEIVVKDAQAALLPRCQGAATRMLEHMMIERPFILSSRLPVPDEIAGWGQRSCDGSVTILATRDPLGALMATTVRHRRDLARILVAGWNDQVLATAGNNDGVIGGNLWTTTPDSARQAFTDPDLIPALSTFLLAGAVDTGAEVSSPQKSPDWDRLIETLLETRLRHEPLDYVLDEVATVAYLAAFNRMRRQPVRDSNGADVNTWSGQVLKLAALLHVVAGGIEEPRIGAEVLERAVTILEGCEHTRAKLRGQSESAGLDHGVRTMAARVQRHGPLTRRDLFRTYAVQDYPRLGEVLATCMEHGLVREEKGKFMTGTKNVGVGASVE